jgi:type I site-specific restriction-modification system R (restriction) subunit
LAVNQFSIQGPQHTRRPDIIIFLNGLPVAVLELKNPADEEADIWKAFDQLQTYKEQIPDLFNTNEILIISDGVTARMGSLTADKERFSTIDKARQSVRVAAYSFTSHPIADALVEAHQRGVDVEVVLDKSQRKRSLAGFLKESGIPVRINRHYAIMHNKFIIIDAKVLELGSFNFTKAAEERNAENVLVLRDQPQIITDYTDQWQKLP